MTTARIYLDHNATTPLVPEARDAMLAAMALCGAASSVHEEGRAVRRRIDEARVEVAALVGARPADVVFVSGASEANMTALTLAWRRGREPAPTRALITAIEHASVLGGGRIDPDAVASLPVARDGRLDLGGAIGRIEAARLDGQAPIVSVMLANNETGVVQPVGELSAAVRAAGGILHSDAAQAVGKIAVSLSVLGVDLLTLSSHKLGGPVGAGALVSGDEALHLDTPLIRGGGQERGRRAGTENFIAIAGFGAAARAARLALVERAGAMRMLRDRLEAGLAAISPDVVIFGRDCERLPNTTCFAEPGLGAETALIAFDLAGFAVSSGSACSSGKVKVSHVLKAMGVDPAQAGSALRLSTGPATTHAEIDAFLAAWQELRDRLNDNKGRRAA